MLTRLPSLNALKAFESVARLGAFNRAAEELNVTESAVSRQIRSLEEDLKIALFRRLHRGVRLSPEGETLARSLAAAFDTIRRGVEEVRRQSGEISVRTPPTFGARWLLPRLRAFETANPDLTVRVSVLWANMQAGDAEHDIGIIYQAEGWPAEDLEPLMSERLTPVCSPAHLANLATRDPVELLARSSLLHCSCVRDWRRWATLCLGEARIDVDRGEIFDTMDTALRAAEAGRGFAIADLSMIEDDLALGRLVAPIDHISDGVDNFYLVRRDRLHPRPEVSRFVDWLRAEVKATLDRPALVAA